MYTLEYFSHRCFKLSYIEIDSWVLEKIFEGSLPYMGMVAILVTCDLVICDII